MHGENMKLNTEGFVGTNVPQKEKVDRIFDS